MGCLWWMSIDTEASAVLHASRVPHFSAVGLFHNQVIVFEPADWLSLINIHYTSKFWKDSLRR